MAIVMCERNHYYDDSRNETFPYCEKEAATNDNSINEQETSFFLQEEIDDCQLTEAYGENVMEYEKTIGIFSECNTTRLTAGWIVALDGEYRGKSYPVFLGRNFAGAADDMDIVLYGDRRISRQKHFSIVFDPKHTEFYILSGEGQVYLNSQPLKSQSTLSEGDIIGVGDTTFIFIPFCKEGRDWS